MSWRPTLSTDAHVAIGTAGGIASIIGMLLDAMQIAAQYPLALSIGGVAVLLLALLNVVRTQRREIAGLRETAESADRRAAALRELNERIADAGALVDALRARTSDESQMRDWYREWDRASYATVERHAPHETGWYSRPRTRPQAGELSEPGWGPASVRRFLPDLIDPIWNRQIDPGKVFDLELPLEQAAVGYRAMDERRAIKTLVTV